MGDGLAMSFGLKGSFSELAFVDVRTVGRTEDERAMSQHVRDEKMRWEAGIRIALSFVPD